mmetsp:Transcript_12775/g.36461  ORF Transcript_12775/g.36461 Transcript_12775/m.36461 type:complete len:271 (+) Transcript_12775:3625-4437(+)
MARKSSDVMLADGRRFISKRLTPRLSLAGPDANSAGLFERLRATLPPPRGICAIGVGVRRALRGGAGGRPLFVLLAEFGFRPCCGCFRPSSDEDMEAEEVTLVLALSGRDKSCGSPTPLSPSPHAPVNVGGFCRFNFRRFFHNSLLLVRLLLPLLSPPRLLSLLRNRSNTLLLALRNDSSDTLVPARLLVWLMAPAMSLTDRTKLNVSLSPVSVCIGLGSDGNGSSKALSLSAFVPKFKGDAVTAAGRRDSPSSAPWQLLLFRETSRCTF